MDLVVHISDEIYKKFMDDRTHVTDILNAVRNGTPIPEPHGRIIDESKIITVEAHKEIAKFDNGMKIIHETITHTDAPTIIEGSGK